MILLAVVVLSLLNNVGFDEEGNYILIFPDGTELVLPEGYEFPEVIPFERSED